MIVYHSGLPRHLLVPHRDFHGFLHDLSPVHRVSCTSGYLRGWSLVRALVLLESPSRLLTLLSCSPGLAVYLTFCKHAGFTHSVIGVSLTPPVRFSLVYTKRELSLRIGYLFVSAALAGACGVRPPHLLKPVSC